MPASADRKEEAAIFRQKFFDLAPNFDPSLANRDVLNSLFAWVWRDDKSNILNLDFDKGLFLFGNFGLGKSLSLLALRQYMNSVKARFRPDDYRLCAWMRSASEIANIYASKGQPELLRYSAPDVNLVIDELGRE
ncbi:MAG: hypothetical protein IJS19_07195, partial [Muribaculaceae bacterium]|nr:hypothetical protein [Muribaculaceae bacterium]